MLRPPTRYRRAAHRATFGGTLCVKIKDIAADLGIACGTLSLWIRTLGTKTTSTARTTATQAKNRAESPEEAPEDKIARMEALVAELETETVKLSTEREILRRAAKYFAGETNW